MEKTSLVPTSYLAIGMSVEILMGRGAVGKAVISEIETALLDFYPATKIVRIMSFSKYFPNKFYAFAFVPGTETQKEGWYPALSKYEYNFEGPVYEIKPT